MDLSISRKQAKITSLVKNPPQTAVRANNAQEEINVQTVSDRRSWSAAAVSSSGRSPSR